MKTPEKEKKKKLVSMTTIIFAVLIIFIAANAVVWKNYFGKSSEINTLTGDVARVSREINKIPEPASDLQSKMSAANAALTAAQGVFPAEFNRNDIIDYIVNLSRECKVEVLPVNSQGWVIDKSNQEYPVLKLSAILTGTFARANDFINKLQNGKYETLVIPELNYAQQSLSDNISGSFSAEKTNVSVKLSISVYAHTTAVKGK
jgi:hypothetical protein